MIFTIIWYVFSLKGALSNIFAAVFLDALNFIFLTILISVYFAAKKNITEHKNDKEVS